MYKELEPNYQPLTIEQVSEKAREVLLETGYHIPTVIVETPEDSSIIHFPKLGETSEERNQQMHNAGWLFAETCEDDTLQQAFLVTEGWLVQPEKGEEYSSPSQHPRRKEVLVVAGVSVKDKKLAQQSRIHEMHRAEDGTLTHISDDTFSEPNVTADNPILMSFILGYAQQIESRHPPPITH